MKILFGATAPPLSKQLEKQYVGTSYIKKDHPLQAAADAIVLLESRGILTENEVKKARHTLMGKLIEMMDEFMNKGKNL